VIVTVELVYDDVPPSANRVGTRGGWRAEHYARKRWRETLEALLLVSGIGEVSYVRASARLRFPSNRRRDAENYVPVLCKALGDALVRRGVIPDDTPDYFRFAGLELEIERGPARTLIELELPLERGD
jgi:hypothetical protein